MTGAATSQELARRQARAGGCPRPRRRRTAWLPRQHGAWVMLALPVLTGAIRSRGDIAQLPLAAFWLSGYLAFAASGTWIAARRSREHLPAIAAYALLATVTGVIALIARPGLARYIPLFVPLLAVAAWCARTRRERSLAANAATTGAASLFGYVVYMAGYSPGGTILAGRAAMAWITVLTAAYFFGTALYVKTLIRERTSVRYRRGSIIYHVAWTACWALFAFLPGWRPLGISSWGAMGAAALFALLTARAAILAGRRVRPLHAGLGEIACSFLLLVIAIRIW